MTNGERLRAMNDEQLAGEICDWIGDSCIDCPGFDQCVMGDGHASGLMEWLQEEVQDE